jgi:hypothetical protein
MVAIKKKNAYACSDSTKNSPSLVLYSWLTKSPVRNILFPLNHMYTTIVLSTS